MNEMGITNTEVGITHKEEVSPYFHGLPLEHWLSRPFHEVLDHAYVSIQNPVFYRSYTDMNACIDVLLTCYCVNEPLSGLSKDTPSEEVKYPDMADIVSRACLRHPSICSTLFHHLLSIPNPAPFINILPSIVIVCPPHMMDDVLDTLIVLLGNSESTVPVLAILLDMNLSLARKKTLVQLVEDIICTTCESDFPPLFKLIFSNLALFSESSLIKKLRTEVNPYPFILSHHYNLYIMLFYMIFRCQVYQQILLLSFYLNR